MRDMLVEILENYARWGLRRQFIVNHHGDPLHNKAIVEAIQALRAQGVETTYFLGGMIQGFVDARLPGHVPRAAAADRGRSAPVAGVGRPRGPAVARLTRSTGLDIHAGERETSLIMRWFPETMAKDVDLAGLKPVPDTVREFQEAEKAGRWRELSPAGHIGDPAKASPENGEIYALEAADMAAALAEFLRAETEPRRPAPGRAKTPRNAGARLVAETGPIKLCVALRPRRRRRKASVGNPTTKGESHLRSNGRCAY